MKKFDVDFAKNLRENKEYDELFHYCQENSGDAEAFAYLAICYLYGYGVEVDYEKSFFYDNRSAEMGCANGMAGLAYDYLEGIGVAVDEERAIELLEKAIVYESPLAYRLLGTCYKRGYGVEKNLKKAVELYNKAVELKDRIAHRLLGECYEQGLGEEKNIKEAISLYNRAVELGDIKSAYYLGVLYSEGKEITKDMDKAVSMFQLAAKKEHTESIRKLAQYYMDGEGVEENEQLAIEYYKEASRLGNAEATCDLALCYTEGIGVVKDLKKAIQLYELSIEQGYEFAMYYLACLYEENSDDNKKNLAFQLFEKLIDAGYICAYYKIGCYLKNGIGTLENIDKAIECYNTCVEYSDEYSEMELANIWENLADCYRKKDDKDSMILAYTKAIQIYSSIADAKDDTGCALYRIGNIYDTGASEIRDEFKAFQYYEGASNRGYLPAKRKVEECYEYGKGVGVDPKKAFALVEQNSKSGDENESLFNILKKAVYYDYGMGVKRNPKKAVKIYENLIKSENNYISSCAKYCMAICLYHGHGIKKDKKRALQLFRETDVLSAKFYIEVIEGNEPSSLFALNIMYHVRKDFILTKQDNNRAFGFCKAAFEVEGNNKYAKELADYYFKGIGTSKNLKKAYELYSKCSGDEIDQRIGEYYYYGCVQKQNLGEAIKRFDYGNRGGNSRSRLYLGLCYLNGKGVERDINYALDLFSKNTEVEDFYCELAQVIRILVIISDTKLYEEYNSSVLSEIEALCHKDTKWKFIFNNGDISERVIRTSGFYLRLLQKKLELPYMRKFPYHILIYGTLFICGEYIRESFRDIKTSKKRPEIEDFYKEIEFLKNALKESQIENQYKDVIIQEKEKYITEMSKQMHYYQDDLRMGLTGISEKLQEVNERTKDVQVELRNLSSFVKEDLTRFIKEQKKQLSQEIQDDFEKSELRITEMCQSISGYINDNTILCSKSLLEREEKYLQSVFGVAWDRLELDSRTSLISAGVLWKMCVGIEGDFDYSGICISATTALESELKKYFFTGFQNYINDTYGAPSDHKDKWKETFDNWPEILLSTTKEKYISDWNRFKCGKGEKPHIRMKEHKHFALGTMPFIFAVIEEGSAEQHELLINRLEEYLSTIIYVPENKSAREVFISRDKGKSFIDKCDRIRKEYRNRAAHDDIISEEQAKGCYQEVIGKIESYEYTSNVTGLLLQLYQYIK